MIDSTDLYATPNALAPHYSHFRVSERLLLTGHSHQAWPDCGFDGQRQAWLDAAELADEKWDKAFEKADRVRAGFRRLLRDPVGEIALGSNTHELVLRFLSALPIRDRPHLITTDGEFHSIRRQLDRLAEEGIQVVKVPASPSRTVAERLSEKIDERTAAVLVSKVFFQNAQIVPGLGELMRACRARGAELLVDVYHALNAIPFSVVEEGLEGAFITGGGYKYCQLGEGNCFLRFPADCSLRPVLTGWFSEFEALESGSKGVVYGRGAARFAGSTYDPTSHYRAAAVFDFFEAEGLTPQLLREVSQHQIRLLVECFDQLDADPKVISRDRQVPLEEQGGFLAFYSPRAREIHGRLRQKGLLTDYRIDSLRLGPAPYLSDSQLVEAMGILGKVVSSFNPPADGQWRR
jgi:kynureninase